MKPCPFCGDSAQLISMPTPKDSLYFKAYVQCTHCSAQGPFYKDLKEFNNQAGVNHCAVEAWDDRR